MTAPHPLDAVTCPQCGKQPARKERPTYRRRGGRLICTDCFNAEKAKDAACTCTTYGHCEVCR